jgi:predicted nucleotidyltransferase
MFGLDKNVIEQIKNVFDEFPQIEEVLLYGSRAKGNYKPGSDIDLSLKGENLNHNLVNSVSYKTR